MASETGELTSEVLAAWREDARRGSDYAEEPESSRILALIDALESTRAAAKSVADDLEAEADDDTYRWARSFAARLRGLGGSHDG